MPATTPCPAALLEQNLVTYLGDQTLQNATSFWSRVDVADDQLASCAYRTIIQVPGESLSYQVTLTYHPGVQAMIKVEEMVDLSNGCRPTKVLDVTVGVGERVYRLAELVAFQKETDKLVAAQERFRQTLERLL